MSKKTEKLNQRIEELEAEIFKMRRAVGVMRNTYEDRFQMILSVLNGTGKMTCYENFTTVSILESLGLE